MGKRRKNGQVKLVEPPDPKGDSGGWAGPPPAHVVPDTARRRAGTYGTLAAPAVELGNSKPGAPTWVGRENASVRAGGRRQRSSQMPRCKGGDRVKVGQGKLNNMSVNRGSKESR